MHRLLLPAILAGCLLAPLATQASAHELERPIIIVDHGHRHGGPWGGPRWGPVVVAPVFPAPVLLPPPPLVVPVVVPQPVAVPVAVPVPVAPRPVGVCGQ